MHADNQKPAPAAQPSTEQEPAIPELSGETKADGALLSDIYFQVAVAFESSFECAPEHITMSVERVERTAEGAIREVEETWVAQGCSRKQAYRILTRPSSAGGVDISVTERK